LWPDILQPMTKWLFSPLYNDTPSDIKYQFIDVSMTLSYVFMSY